MAIDKNKKITLPLESKNIWEKSEEYENPTTKIFLRRLLVFLKRGVIRLQKRLSGQRPLMNGGDLMLGELLYLPFF